MEKKDYYTELHNQIIGWTNNCDTKASIVLAFMGILVSITFTSDYILSGVEIEIKNIIDYWQNGIGSFNLLSFCMFLALIGFVLTMTRCCLFAISSLKANVTCPNNSIIFFGKIAELTLDNYIEKVNDITNEGYEQDKLSQIHICATICNNKFMSYNKSIKYLCMGLFLFVCFVFFIIILKSL
jgi:hypothetical protein